MGRREIRLVEIGAIYARTGATAFGGWSATALLLEKELVDKRRILSNKQIKGAVAYAQILPGSTRVSIVANTGYQLRGFWGALLATASYLLPAIGLIVVFSMLYFHMSHSSSGLGAKLDGLVAALSGVILANAYKIGSKHTTKTWLWLLVAVAFAAKLWLEINALVIIVIFGFGGLLLSWTKARRLAK